MNMMSLVNVLKVTYILRVLEKCKTVMQTLIFMSHAFRVIFILMDSLHTEFLLLVTEKYTSELPGLYGRDRA